MKRRIDGWVYLTTIEAEQYAAFDLPTRRFIAYALTLAPELAARLLTSTTVAGNMPLPFDVADAERQARGEAYARLAEVRACRAKGAKGQRERRLLFADLLGMARVDVRFKRLGSYPAFHFCYERLAGPAWRELLPACWREAQAQRSSKAAGQLPLIPILREDCAVPNLLEDDWAPTFIPSLADADGFGSPLLAGF